MCEPGNTGLECFEWPTMHHTSGLLLHAFASYEITRYLTVLVEA